MAQHFFHRQIMDGINLYVFPTKKFKTILVQVFLHQQLQRDLATPTALLPMILTRGSQKHPSVLEIASSLEALFGAEIGTGVLKKGERQIISFALDIIDRQFLPKGEAVLKAGLEILRDIMQNPLLEDNVFKKNYLAQEKEQLKKHIKGLINDKMALSVERCLQIMCVDEPYGTYKYGYTEEIEKIDTISLSTYYQNFIHRAPVDFFVVGDVKTSDIQALIEEIFTFSSDEKYTLPSPQVVKEVGEEKIVEEKMAINQGKLSLGYRTNIPYGEDIFPLTYYNGILGGFSHSKLFQNVREKAGLAYYVFSRLERTKGLMLISSGIEVENYDRTLEIIRKQLESVSAGEISDQEFANTRTALLSQARLQEDSPSQLVGSIMEGIINGKIMDQSEIIDKLARVTKEDVVRVAQRIKLDTIYFLRS